jgi:hypothetical protein
MRALWLWLPDEAMVLVIAGIGLALMFGFIRGRAAMALLGTVILTLLAGPFIDALLDMLPGWMLLLLLLWVGVALFRWVLSFIVGARAADEAVGSLTADVIRAGFRLLLLLACLPFRILWWVFRRA